MKLTDEQIMEIVREASKGSAMRRDGSTSMRIARAIEAAVLAQGEQCHCGKDEFCPACKPEIFAPEAKQEPVLWQFRDSEMVSPYSKDNVPDWRPLFTHPAPQAKQEPLRWVDLQPKAQAIVEGKILWRRFIDGTPLANDIACWMADFALEHSHPAPVNTALLEALKDLQRQYRYVGDFMDWSKARAAIAAAEKEMK